MTAALSAPGYYPPLDAVKELKEDSHKLILELQNKYAEAVNIPNLKIKYNNVIGYFIEVQSKFATEMLENKDFYSPSVGAECRPLYHG